MSSSSNGNNTRCYNWYTQSIEQNHNVCSPSGVASQAQSCCDAHDICLEDYICYSPDKARSQSLSDRQLSYYIGSCTDPNFPLSGCSGACSKKLPSQGGSLIVINLFVSNEGRHGSTYILFNSTTNDWRCCNSTALSPDCSTTTDYFSLHAPAPDQLSTIANRPIFISATASAPTQRISSAASSTLQSPGATVSHTPSSTCISAKDCASHPSLGECAGIGAGSAIAGLGFLIATAILIRKLISKKKALNFTPGSHGTDQDSQNASLDPPTFIAPVQEIYGELSKELEGLGFVEMQNQHRVELDHQQRIEMSG